MRLAATVSGEAAGKAATDRAGWLGLAAAPTFVGMAFISALGAPGVCSATWAPVNDMALMYLLMGVFHLSPWLRLFPAGSQCRAGQT